MANETRLVSLEGSSDNLLLDVDRKVLRRLFGIEARAVAKAAKTQLKGGGGGGRKYYNSGGKNADRPYLKKHHQASSPGNLPASVTGALVRSIRGMAWRDGNGATVVVGAFYSRFITQGTATIDPRMNALEKALADQSSGIISRVAEGAAAAFEVRRK